MTSYSDATGLYPVKRRARHAEREGFRISEIALDAGQNVPWHYHTNIADTFYVLNGVIAIALRGPEEQIQLERGETYTVVPGREHEVTVAEGADAAFLIMQGFGQYDFVPTESGTRD